MAIQANIHQQYVYSLPGSLDKWAYSKDFWILVLRIPLTVINSIGLVANVMLFIFLLILRKRHIISEAGLLVLLNQAFIDFWNVTLAILYTVSDLNSLPQTYGDLEWIRAVICYLWHTQFPYWITYCVSVFNEMFLSVER